MNYTRNTGSFNVTQKTLNPMAKSFFGVIFVAMLELNKTGEITIMTMHNQPCNSANQQCGTQPHPAYEIKPGCTTAYHQDCSMPDKLLWLADEAWEELMREKIRDHIEASCGTMMDEVAKMTAETSTTRWKHKMAKKHLYHDFKHGLRELMCTEGSCKQSS